MKRYYRSANDPKRFKPLVTLHNDAAVPYWVVTTTTIDGNQRVRVVDTFEEAIRMANKWADDYRAAWVERNMRFQEEAA
jgi:acyl-ACP thioesterase